MSGRDEWSQEIAADVDARTVDVSSCCDWPAESKASCIEYLMLVRTTYEKICLTHDVLGSQGICESCAREKQLLTIAFANRDLRYWDMVLCVPCVGVLFDSNKGGSHDPT